MSVRVPFGKYELVERLAQGGMGETWLADLNALEGVTKQVVLKKMLPDLASSPKQVQAFIEEARLSATLSHGNIAQVFDFGQVDGEYYIALEFIDGQSLERVITRAKKLETGGRLPFALSVHIVIELLKALHYAHTRNDSTGQPLNLVHRDVSPDNVLISYDGEVKLVDFGVAKTSDLGRSKTTPGMVKGKYRYLSPEQALAERLDRRSDIFGAGIVLFELLSGGPMFLAEGHVAMQQVANGEIPSLRARAGDVPDELVTITMKALARRRDDRFATAVQMQEQLAGWLARTHPEFSTEALRRLMGKLFHSELAAEGRAPPKSELGTQNLRAHDATPRLAPAAASPAAPPPASRRLALALGAAALVVMGGTAWFLLGGSPAPDCERAAEPFVTRGDEQGARNALLQCLGTRAPSPTETVALARFQTCTDQRVRLKEAELGLSLREGDRVDRALGFVPASCVVAAHHDLVQRLRALREEERVAAEVPRNTPVTEPLAEPAASTNPEALALFDQARAAFDQKSYGPARTLLQRCVKLDPKNYECHRLLGAVYAWLGDGAAGAKSYERFLELAPSHPLAPKVRGLLDAFRAQQRH